LLVGGQYVAIVGEWRVARFAEFLGATPGGNLALLRLIVAVILLVSVALKIGRRARLWLAGLCGVILALTVNRGSHAAALLPDVGAWVDLGHLLAAGAWGGGLALLAWLATPNVVRRIRQENPGREVVLLAAAAARFSVLALATVSLAVASGLLLAAWFLPGWDALWRTLYGSALSAKLALLAAAVTLGALHRYRNLPRLEAHAATEPDEARDVRRFAWSIRAEVAAVAGIMLLSGLLTSAPPATTVMSIADDGPGEWGHTVQGHLGQRAMQVETIPLQVGLNIFDVHFSDSTPELENLTLLLRLPAQDIELPSFDLHEVEPGLWSTVGALPVAGEWQVRASAFIDGSFQAERFTLALASDGHTHDGHTHEDEHDRTHEHEEGGDAISPETLEPETATRNAGFAALLRLSAALVLGAGLGVVLFDLRRMRRPMAR
jgi:copper transport protein